MKVVKHSSSQLVILAGESSYNLGGFIIASNQNLFRIPLVVFILSALSAFIIHNSILVAILLGTFMAIFPCLGMILVMRSVGSGRPETYEFDKFSNVLSCSKPALLPWNPPQVIKFLLNEIVEVESVIEQNDEPPPLYWYSIKLKMKEKTITLYPGNNEEDMKKMSGLIRQFLGL